MRRFTDVVLFGALFLLDALAWLILSVTGGITASDPGRIAPMTVGTVIVIACPALLVATVMALARALANTSPRGFYAWSLAAGAVGGIVAALANPVAAAGGVEVGFGWMAWFFGVMSLAYVVALLIALTGGIEQRAPKEVRRAQRQAEKETAEAAEQEPSPAPVIPAAGAPAAVPSVPDSLDEGDAPAGIDAGPAWSGEDTARTSPQTPTASPEGTTATEGRQA